MRRLSEERVFVTHRAYSSECLAAKPYRDGGRFSIVKGHAWFSARGLDFGKGDVKDREYNTVFGPVFCHTGVKLKLNDVGLLGAVTRLTCAREPDRPGFHEDLRDQQFQNYGTLPGFTEFKRHIAGYIREYESDLAFDRQRLEWVEAPHPKKKLRVRTHTELDLSAGHAQTTWLNEKKRIRYLGKSKEILPGADSQGDRTKGKYLRATADLAPAAAEQGGYMMATVKEAFAETFKYKGCSYKFVKKPEREILIDAFQDIQSNEDDITLRCFSDDAMLGINTPEGRFVANTDISACDGSNYDPVFLYLYDIMIAGGLHTPDVEGVFNQCLGNVCFESYRDYEFNRKIRRVTLKPEYYTLYSGSTLTTSINNCANLGIFLAIVEFLPPYAERTLADLPGQIAAAAHKVGYQLKCQVCSRIEDMQFLKISPTIVGGEMEVFLNLGVLLRNLGSCHGDLPGRGDIATRASVYSSDVVKSYVHAGDHVITDALKSWIVESTLNVDVAQKLTGAPKRQIPTSALSARYGMDEAEFDMLAVDIRDNIRGLALSSRLLDRIYELDYGYPPLSAVKPLPNRRIVHDARPTPG